MTEKEVTEKMKRIALLNIQRCDSHGAVLLAYALETVLGKAGEYEITTLDYKYAGRIVEKNPLKRIWRIVGIKLKKQMHLGLAAESVLGQSVKAEYDKQTEYFKAFRKKYLHLSKEITDVHDDVLKSFDAFIVGSDVVWKPEIVRCEDREIYFLKSVPQNALKIAYAASIGTNDPEVLSQYEDNYRQAFDSFDFLSIREQSMIPFVKRFTQKEVCSVIDPVFLLKPGDYQEIEKNAQKTLNGKPYVYVYLLGKNRSAVTEANRIAKQRGLSVLLDMNDGFQDAALLGVETELAISAGPAEFLYNIRNAACVITDSFHATAFSVLFNREMWVFKRGKISVRMDDLLMRFGISERMCDDTLAELPIDWDRINAQIDCERKEGLNYLRQALNQSRRE